MGVIALLDNIETSGIMTASLKSASELLPDECFSLTSRKNASRMIVKRTITLGDKSGPKSHHGKILVVTADCQQRILDPTYQVCVWKL